MKPLLTVEELTAVLSLSETTVYDLVSSGRIACYRVTVRGKHGVIRFSEQHIQDYLTSCEHKAGQPQKTAPRTPQPKRPPLKNLSLD